MTRTAGRGWAGRAALALGLLAVTFCLTAGQGQAARSKAPPVLAAEEGATVTGKLRPGERAEDAITLE
ncbi:MAG TPA: hypothetical protein VLF66_13735 [Thermoanaerobaculia bacterium]|nr:hypothetical protein [Thermoanaerobaculia bacterium]